MPLKWTMSTEKGKVHAGAVVIPASLAIGENLCSDGRSLILATFLGYEVAIRIAIGVGAKSHRMKGWHATVNFLHAARCDGRASLGT